MLLSGGQGAFEVQAIQGTVFQALVSRFQRTYRVPYNQAAINDVNQRYLVMVLLKSIECIVSDGHITGSQYILRACPIALTVMAIVCLFQTRWNIFSINAKTGYFVGSK